MPPTLSDLRRRFFALRTVDELRAAAEATTLHRRLGWAHLLALGVGAIVGAGVFLVVGEAAANRAGPAVALSFVLVAIASATVALAYAELAAMIPLGGSGYVYATAAFGEFPAWLMGWTLVLSYLIGNGAIAAGFSANAVSLLAAAGWQVPELLRAAPPDGLVDLPAMLVVLAITFLLARPVQESVGVTAVIVAIKVGILLVFAVVAFLAFDPANLTPFAPFGWTGVVGGAAFALFAFLGFDTVSTAAEEVRDPARDLPLGILGSLVACAALYVVVAIAMTGAVPYTALGVADPLAEVMRILDRPFVGVIMNAGGLLATLTVLIAFQFGGARIVLNMARDGFVPARFARVNARTGTPLVTTYAAGVVVALAAGLVPLELLVELTNVSILVVFILVLVAVLALRRRAPGAPRPFRMPLAWAVAPAGVLMLGALMLTSSARSWSGYALWTGVGFVIYALYRAPRTRAA